MERGRAARPGRPDEVSSAVGNNADNTAAPGQTASYTVYMDPALGEGAHVFHSTGDSPVTGPRPVRRIISEPAGSQWLDPNNNNAPLASGWDATIQMPQGPASASSRCSSTRSATKGTGRSTRSPVPPATPPKAK